MKVKITVVVDIEGKIDSDMYSMVQDTVSGIQFVNEVTEVSINPVIARRRVK